MKFIWLNPGLWMTVMTDIWKNRNFQEILLNFVTTILKISQIRKTNVPNRMNTRFKSYLMISFEKINTIWFQMRICVEQFWFCSNLEVFVLVLKLTLKTLMPLSKQRIFSSKNAEIGCDYIWFQIEPETEKFTWFHLKL
jgi:hypothetical protein